MHIFICQFFSITFYHYFVIFLVGSYFIECTDKKNSCTFKQATKLIMRPFFSGKVFIYPHTHTYNTKQLFSSCVLVRNPSLDRVKKADQFCRIMASFFLQCSAFEHRIIYSILYSKICRYRYISFYSTTFFII